MLRGFDQKVSGQGWSAKLSGHMDMSTAGGKAGPKPGVSFRRNVVSP